MTVKQVLEFAKKNNTEIVDLRFTDLPGLWQHFSISMNEFDTGLFENGIGFDGSSIRGFPIPTSSPFTTTSSRGGFETRPYVPCSCGAVRSCTALSRSAWLPSSTRMSPGLSG